MFSRKAATPKKTALPRARRESFAFRVHRGAPETPKSLLTGIKEDRMKTLLAVATCIVLVSMCLAQGDSARGAAVATEVTPPLRLVQAIPLPNVAGRIDHFTLDTKRKWVIGSALGNNSAEVVDAFAGRVVKAINGLDEPQGVLFVGDPVNKLFVANAGDGKLRIYDGKTFNLAETLDFKENTDNLRYDPAEKRVYVGYGEDEGSGIGVVDALTNKRLDDAGKLEAHPESFQLELSGSRIFVNIAAKNKISVIDRKTRK